MRKAEKACVTDKCNSVLDIIVQTILPYKLVKFLNTQLVETKYVYLNLWHILHFVWGIIFFFIWVLFFENLLLGFWVWFLVHSLWEISEFLMALNGLYHELFYEEFVDIAWDTITSLLGYAVVWLIFFIL
jgi:hypothetical protein